MKIIASPVEVVAKFNLSVNRTPARFGIAGRVIDVEQIRGAIECKNP